jgi:hypothetical protein
VHFGNTHVRGRRGVYAYNLERLLNLLSYPCLDFETKILHFDFICIIVIIVISGLCKFYKII